MRKSIFAVCILAVCLFCGSALADYNKNYDDPTGDVIKIGDVLEESIDITNVKTTDVGDSVRFELTVTGPIESDMNHIYFWNLGDFDYEAMVEGTFWGLMYIQGIGALVQPDGTFTYLTVWIDNNTLNVTVDKSKLPSSADFDVTAFTLYTSGDMNPESMDFCPLIEFDMDMDTDNDGMDDIWEVQYFEDLDETASGDADGDGCSNLNEFKNGTDPTDANECTPSEKEAAFLGLALYIWIILVVIIVAVIIVIAVAVYQRSKTRETPPPPGELPPPPPGYPPSE